MTKVNNPLTPRVAPISVVIPAYNSSSMLRATIQSVHSQTLGVAEIIVVDDGSTDDTSEIASGMGATVIRQPNSGISAARNTGITNASQPWIAFLDHDDLWDSQKISAQWQLHLAAPRAGLICVDHRKCRADGTVVQRSCLEDPGMRFQDLQREYVGEQSSWFPRLTPAFGEAGMFLYPSCVMVRRDVLLGVGLFAADLDISEDVECFLRVLARTPLAVVERPLVTYRIHDKNTSSDQLRMTLGAIAMTRRILAAPDRYPPGAAERFGKSLYRKQAAAGRMLLDSGRMREARAMLSASLQRKFGWNVGVFWLLSWFGPMSATLIKLRRLSVSSRRDRKIRQARDGS
jgi:glycosyltransferase involved in cell wall biosynthesis